METGRIDREFLQLLILIVTRTIRAAARAIVFSISSPVATFCASRTLRRGAWKRRRGTPENMLALVTYFAPFLVFLIFLSSQSYSFTSPSVWPFQRMRSTGLLVKRNCRRGGRVRRDEKRPGPARTSDVIRILSCELKDPIL